MNRSLELRGSRKRADFARRGFVAWFCALAIAFQCVVLQGHFHLTSSSLPAFEQASVPGSEAPAQKGKAPAGDPSGCFICQQMAMAGSAVLPGSPEPVVVATSEASTPAPADIVAVEATPSHHWQ